MTKKYISSKRKSAYWSKCIILQIQHNNNNNNNNKNNNDDDNNDDDNNNNNNKNNSNNETSIFTYIYLGLIVYKRRHISV